MSFLCEHKFLYLWFSIPNKNLFLYFPEQTKKTFSDKIYNLLIYIKNDDSDTIHDTTGSWYIYMCRIIKCLSLPSTDFFKYWAKSLRFYLSPKHFKQIIVVFSHIDLVKDQVWCLKIIKTLLPLPQLILNTLFNSTSGLILTTATTIIVRKA